MVLDKIVLVQSPLGLRTSDFAAETSLWRQLETDRESRPLSLQLSPAVSSFVLDHIRRDNTAPFSATALYPHTPTTMTTTAATTS